MHAVAPESFAYRPIGHFRTPHKAIAGMPIQPIGALGVSGSIVLLPGFAQGLQDLDGFSHVIVLYHLHQVRGHSLMVTPFLDTQAHGIFATRSPSRPNPIGLSVLRLAGVSGCCVHVENVDVLDNTPVLDIKPYVPDFDRWDADRIGWFAGKSGQAVQHRSDTRFADAPLAEEDLPVA
ncbi:tRNA (N6-threonylcarbamoyladenosine(37)-N6)-methyltransferase TrmO [Megalodesulfovibrio gigas]|uniref:tRNA (N6-threonylcarbamoyladenosine(37)-N6)-methyltransferase TrmO n=1 Tax=Megalodesulfovibrio gigas TaxID=879 RepID=UPI00040B617D|nr:tRNA (N6-threonylcarbamoyladenosine(37)-N6)-methyltransferase TrmO [Megalodesulfovibrio gigas]